VNSRLPATAQIYTLVERLGVVHEGCCGARGDRRRGAGAVQAALVAFPAKRVNQMFLWNS
jgi:hypothetical protein